MGAGHALLDVGGGARLERFGARVTDRPHPGALGARGGSGGLALPPTCASTATEAGAATRRRRAVADRDRWADARAEGDRGRPGRALPGTRGDAAVAARAGRGEGGRGADAAAEPPAVLHLFAYTGLVTLALAAAGASVVHVDASQADRRLGTSQRRALRPGRSPDPLDRRRRERLHRARGPARPPIRRHRPRPTELRARSGLAAPGGSRTTCPPSSPRPAACSSRTASSC